MGDPIILVETVPEVEFRNGYFHVVCPATGIHRAYPPHVFFQTLALMAAIAREFRFVGAEVVELPLILDEGQRA